jgi:hypothetical protein
LAIVAVLIGMPFAAKAVIPNPNQIAPNFMAWLVQGFDECDAMTAPTTVDSISACPRSSGSTQTFRLARLIISRSGRVVLAGSGFPSAQQARLKLTVRTTNRSGQPATYVDSMATCPVFTCSAGGVCLQVTMLSSCGGLSSGALLGVNKNIEIVAAELLDATPMNSGDVLGRIGIIR